VGVGFHSRESIFTLVLRNHEIPLRLIMNITRSRLAHKKDEFVYLINICLIYTLFGNVHSL